jgi:hypothetical protein
MQKFTHKWNRISNFAATLGLRYHFTGHGTRNISNHREAF